jgi:hypothetical protein
MIALSRIQVLFVVTFAIGLMVAEERRNLVSAQQPLADLINSQLALAKQKAQARRDEALAQAKRTQIVMRALELEALRKKQLRGEGLSLAELRARKSAQVEFKKRVNGWAMERFEPRRVVGSMPRNAPRLLQRWEKARMIARTQFLRFPEKSRGAIKNGRALNYFLDLLGPTAMQHSLAADYAKQNQLETTATSRLVAIAIRLKAAPAGDHRNALISERDRLRIQLARLRLIERLGAKLAISEQQMRNLSITTSSYGAKLKIRLGRDTVDPLPLEWPHVLRRPKYAAVCLEIETLKKSILNQLKQGQHINPESCAKLMKAVEDLQSRFRENFRNYSFRERNPARKFIMTLRHGAGEIIRANYTEDIKPKAFQGRTIAELLAYMTRHDLRFAEANANEEKAHAYIFQLLVSYYSDLYSLHLSLKEQETELVALDRKIKKLAAQEREETVTRILRHLDEKKDPVEKATSFLNASASFLNALRP